jgi:UTP--glucose-1-phosphate uridylyltransferase
VTITDAVVPVAGLGTRLLPATKSQPKEMLPIVDAPVVQYVVEELVRGGVKRVLFVTGRRKRAIEDHFDADPELERVIGPGPRTDMRGGVQILYTRQPSPRGLGDALRCAEGFAGDRPVVVALGDTIVTGRGPGIVRRLVDAFERTDSVAALAVEALPDADLSRYGVVAVAATAGDDSELDVADVIEKPRPGEAPSRYAIAARYVLAPAVFAALRETAPDEHGEVQVADALRTVIASGGRVIAVPLAEDERRHDIGTVESYCATFIEFALRDPQLGPALRRRAAALLDGGG